MRILLLLRKKATIVVLEKRLWVVHTEELQQPSCCYCHILTWTPQLQHRLRYIGLIHARSSDNTSYQIESRHVSIKKVIRRNNDVITGILSCSWVYVSTESQNLGDLKNEPLSPEPNKQGLETPIQQSQVVPFRQVIILIYNIGVLRLSRSSLSLISAS